MKKILLFALLFVSVYSFGQKKISELPPVTSLTGTELIPIVQAGVNKTVTPAQLGGPYKVYTALISQSGTDDPVPIILQNTLGVMAYERNSIGVYDFILPVFDGKLFILAGPGITPRDVRLNYSTSGRTINIETFTDLTPADDRLNDYPIEVRMYPTPPLDPTAMVLEFTSTTEFPMVQYTVLGPASIFSVDWGDGITETFTPFTYSPMQSHTYASAGVHRAFFRGTPIGGLDFSYSPLVTKIIQFGQIGLSNFTSMFRSCPNLVGTIPDMSGFVDGQPFNGMFYGDSGLTGNAPALWTMYPSSYGMDCFTGCTGLMNWGDIPSGWRQ